ncbi:MAG: amino acid ABC transporter permease [Spirochaetales bacterium]|nr:amino acid ABC transporter permease [Spirochaetales bacterium]
MKLDYSIIIDRIPNLLWGCLVTLEISLAALALGMVIGIVLALFRISSVKPLKAFSMAYIWAVRGTPLLVQLFILYFGLPQLGVELSSMTAGILGIGLNTAAYISEIIRSGIIAIDSGQMEAAESLGMSYPKAMIRIIAPQVMRIIAPSLVNQFIITLKNSSIASLVTITELMRAGNQIIYATFRSFEVYTVVALLYLIMCSALMVLSKYVEKKLDTDNV